MKFNIDIDKTLEASLYVLGKLPSCDMHKLFKILYFAESEHLAEYGRPITGDEYIAMQNGPVPSFLRDIIKSINKPSPFFKSDIDAKKYFELVNYFVGAKRECNLDYLSGSDIECLDNAIELLKHTGFGERTAMSHNEAWNKANVSFDGNYIPVGTMN